MSYSYSNYTMIGIEVPLDEMFDSEGDLILENWPEGFKEALEERGINEFDEPVSCPRDVGYYGQSLDGYEIRTRDTHENKPRRVVLGVVLSDYASKSAPDSRSWSREDVEDMFQTAEKELKSLGFDQEPEMIQLTSVL